MIFISLAKCAFPIEAKYPTKPLKNKRAQTGELEAQKRVLGVRSGGAKAPRAQKTGSEQRPTRPIATRPPRKHRRRPDRSDTRTRDASNSAARASLSGRSCSPPPRDSLARPPACAAPPPRSVQILMSQLRERERVRER